MGRKIVDETGNRYERLLVTEEAGRKWGKVFWKCLCDCGNEVIVCGGDLRSGNTISCGCLRREKIIEQNKDRTGENHPFFGKTHTEETRQKMSEAAKGHTRNKGENNPNWKGGITPENDKLRKSPKAKEWRTAVFERDNYTCQLCNKKSQGDIQAHHIGTWNNYSFARLLVCNGITLCKKCHNSIKGKELSHVQQFYHYTMNKGLKYELAA